MSLSNHCFVVGFQAQPMFAFGGGTFFSWRSVFHFKFQLFEICLFCNFWLTLEAKKIQNTGIQITISFFDKLCFIVFVLSTSGLFCCRGQIHLGRLIMCWCLISGSREGKLLNKEGSELSRTIWTAAETGLAWFNRKLYSSTHLQLNITGNTLVF